MNLKRICRMALLCWLTVAAGDVAAQTNRPALKPAKHLTNRYLLVVETSREMQPRRDAALRAVRELLASQMGGQLHLGDTVGLWTFSSSLETGHFPLQECRPGNKELIADRAYTFLAAQEFTGRARLKTVLPMLRRVVADSDFITVVLVTSGDEELEGTPFDEPLNSFYRKWRRQERKAKMPFLTAFRAQRGQIQQYAVNVAPWRLDLPALPAELLAAESAPPPQPAKPKPAPAPRLLPPLIISGRKPAPEPSHRTHSVALAQPESTSPHPAAPVTLPPTSKPVEPPSAPAGSVLGAHPQAVVTPAPAVTPPAPANSSPQPAAPPATAEPNQIAAVQPTAPASAPTEGPVSPAEKAETPAATASQRTSPPDPTPAEVEAAAASPLAAAAPASLGLWLRWGLLSAGLLLAVGLGWFWFARPRNHAHISLITRSLDRHEP